MSVLTKIWITSNSFFFSRGQFDGKSFDKFFFNKGPFTQAFLVAPKLHEVSCDIATIKSP